MDVSSLSKEGGPIEILVGVDAPEIHAGNTLLRENVAMRLTIIGPVVFGSAASNIPGPHHVYTVSVAAPVDLPAFWESEQMGVAINLCCQGRKFTEGEKLLNPVEKKGGQVDSGKSETDG